MKLIKVLCKKRSDQARFYHWINPYHICYAKVSHGCYDPCKVYMTDGSCFEMRDDEFEKILKAIEEPDYMTMISNTVQELTKERTELIAKIEDLKVCMTDIFGKTEQEMKLLSEQHDFMCALASILEDRIKLIENHKKQE